MSKKYVKCKETGESIDKFYAFSILIKGNKRVSYFKSEELYLKYQDKLKIKEEEKSLWNSCNDLVVSLIPKQANEVYPPYLFKKINDIRKKYSTSFLFYLLSNQKVRENFIVFKKHNPKSTLSHKVNMFLYFIKEGEETIFKEYTSKLTEGLNTYTPESFTRHQSSTTTNTTFLKYLEDD